MGNWRVMGLAAAALLSACGGGGGGGGTAAGGTGNAPAAVQITQDNAKPVGADASGTVQNTSAVQGTAGLVAGVQVQGGGGAQVPSTLVLAEIVRTLGIGSAGAALPVGVTVPPTTEACPNGGTITVSGTVASDTSLNAGDSLSVSASNCGAVVAGQAATISGSLSFGVNSGSMTPSVYPFHIVMAMVATDLSVTSGGITHTSNGDVMLDWRATAAAAQTMTATGASLANGSTESGALRTTTWRDYTQVTTLNNTLFTGTLAGGVESNNPRLGSAGGSYTVTTPAAVQWDAATGTPSAGVIRVVGAGNSALRITFGAGTATLDVDADGNGSYESTVNSTPAELKSLL